MVGENQNFSGKAPSMEQLQALLTSPEGVRLLQLLRKDGGKGMQTAAEALKRGDAEGAKAALSRLMGEEEAQSLGSGLNRRL